MKTFLNFLIMLFSISLTVNSLRAQVADEPAAGDGTSGDPYQIATLNNIYWIAADESRWDKNYIQIANIDASETSGWFSGQGWLPIGSWPVPTFFSGSYNGQDYTIDGLFINRGAMSYIGLFGYINGADISNLGLTNVNITGNSWVGGLVGAIDNSTISNSYSTGSVTGLSEGVGGLVGINATVSPISNSYSTSSVSGGSQYTGGLVGWNHSSIISDSYSTGSVNGSGGYAGGLVGLNNTNATINNSHSTGNVDGGERTGGLVGQNYNSTIIDSYSTGSVGGSQFSGGLVGLNWDNATISTSYSTGSVSGTSLVGGLAGNSVNATISTSYSTGSVSGSLAIGGLVGQNLSSTINDCYSTGSVSGNENIGGLVGDNASGADISNSYSTGRVSGTTSIGGLVGRNNNSTITDSYWNTTTSEQAASDGGTGLPNSQFRSQASFIGFDFVDEWDIAEDESFPFLRDNPQDPPPGYLQNLNISSSSDLSAGTYGDITISGAGTIATLTGDVTVMGALMLGDGSNLSIGANTLILFGAINFNGGKLSGHDNGNLIINGSGIVTGDLLISGSKYINNVSILRNEDINLGGEIHILGDLTLDDGATLSIGNNNLHLYGDLDLGISGMLEGGPDSYLLLRGSGDITLPELDLGQLAVHRDNAVNLSEAMTISKHLRMYKGTLNTDNNLTLSNNCNLWIKSGQITGTPTFGLNHNIYYEDGNAQLNTGSEITNPNRIPLITVKSTIPLVIQNDILSLQRMIIYAGSEVDVNGKNISLAGTIEERNGGLLFSSSNGTVTITRNIGKVSGLDVGGLGATFTTRKNLGSTEVVRGFEAQTVDGNPGIKRYYNITPTVTNTDIDLEFNYHESELNNNDEATLQLYISTDDGTTWNPLGTGGIVDAENNRITLTGLTGINAISGRVTAKGNQIGDGLIVERNNETEFNKLPTEFEIVQNYPNPFNPTTTIKFGLPKDDIVTLKVFDISGREVMQLTSGEFKSAGYHSVQFDGSNLSSGIYFYRISTASGFEKVMRMLLVK